jgi:hypothetical protein
VANFPGALQIGAVGQATNGGGSAVGGRLAANYNKFQCDNLKCTRFKEDPHEGEIIRISLSGGSILFKQGKYQDYIGSFTRKFYCNY